MSRNHSARRSQVRIGAGALPAFGERHRLVARLASGNKLYLDTWRAFSGDAHRYVLKNGWSHGALLDRSGAARVLRGAKARRAWRVSEPKPPKYQPPIDANNTAPIGGSVDHTELCECGDPRWKHKHDGACQNLACSCYRFRPKKSKPVDP